MAENEYINFIIEVKQSILQSRYRAASLANREMLLLYYETGKRLSEKIKSTNWGAKIIRTIADDLQKELPGLRGFSYSNLQNMKLFFEEYSLFSNFLIQTTDNEVTEIVQMASGQLENSYEEALISQLFNNSVLCFDTKTQQSNIIHFIETIFLKIGFSQHILLIQKCKNYEQRLFYFLKTIENQWSYTILEHHLCSKLFERQGKIQNNFEKTLPFKLLPHATDAFKDEYLLDFINIQDDDDERVFENEIVLNIKKFIMSLGNDFTFMGNQYRMVVEEEEFFVDLLFFHRTLQSLVAFELKRGKFKPEYAGKMNFYLSALDKFVKKEHENPSIGIILCKEKKDSIVEFAFNDYNKAMGVATYKTSRQIPEKFRGLLPDSEELKKLL